MRKVPWACGRDSPIPFHFVASCRVRPVIGQPSLPTSVNQHQGRGLCFIAGLDLEKPSPKSVRDCSESSVSSKKRASRCKHASLSEDEAGNVHETIARARFAKITEASGLRARCLIWRAAPVMRDCNWTWRNTLAWLRTLKQWGCFDGPAMRDCRSRLLNAL